jgi:redox-sensitive bicupin YhaK (pirin superfamily)
MNTTIAVHNRAIVHRTRGLKHGPVTRLVGPGDLGQLLKPFVFLDLASFDVTSGNQGFPMHPHSGIATLSFMTQGSFTYEDTTGQQGVLAAGGVEWMKAGVGVWHTATPVGDTPVRGFQLWIALPASEENTPAQSMYLAPSDVPQAESARVLLGRYGEAQSPIKAPAQMTYLSVSLRKGERWRFTPPDGQTVAWIAVNGGQLSVREPVDSGELVIFEESQQAIDFVAQSDATFVLGSAAKHPHDLVLGNYSVHTSASALALGEAGIRRSAALLRRDKQHI